MIVIVKLTSKMNNVVRFVNMNNVVYWTSAKDGGSILQFTPMAWFQMNAHAENEKTEWMQVKESPEQIERLIYEAQIEPLVDSVLGDNNAN